MKETNVQSLNRSELEQQIREIIIYDQTDRILGSDQITDDRVFDVLEQGLAILPDDELFRLSRAPDALCTLAEGFADVLDAGRLAPEWWDTIIQVEIDPTKLDSLTRRCKSELESDDFIDERVELLASRSVRQPKREASWWPYASIAVLVLLILGLMFRGMAGKDDAESSLSAEDTLVEKLRNASGDELAGILENEIGFVSHAAFQGGQGEEPIRIPKDGKQEFRQIDLTEKGFIEAVSKMQWLHSELLPFFDDQQAAAGGIAYQVLNDETMRHKAIVSFSRLSWLIATASDSDPYDLHVANQFVEAAKILAEVERHPLLLDTQAAIHAANGKWELAIECQKKANEEARKAGDLPVMMRIRLELYRKHESFQKERFPDAWRREADFS